MKAALQFSDRLTTVSPGYAREILGETQGCGLDGLLRERAHLLSGILNGVDYQIWSPEADPLLPKPFDAKRLAGKGCQKEIANPAGPGATCRCAGIWCGELPEYPKAGTCCPRYWSEWCTAVASWRCWGEGDHALEQALRDAAQQYPGQVGLRIGYDEATAHTVLGGADVVLVPSAFEPCGLTQLYGLRYGTLPLVRRVGGLADTVVDCNAETQAAKTATGFVFDDLTAEALHTTMQRAFALYQDPTAWKVVQRRAMAMQFDGASSARHYCDLYSALRNTH